MYANPQRQSTVDRSFPQRDQRATCDRPGLARASIHHDGIAITEFPLDSLPCSTDRFEGSLPDGQFFEKNLTRPGSLPYRCLIPSGISNLLVPTAPSVTHCAWGTVRQSSCLLHFSLTQAVLSSLRDCLHSLFPTRASSCLSRKSASNRQRL